MTRQLTFEAIGTGWVIDINQEISEEAFRDLFVSISKRIEEFDKNYSRFREDSLVSAMSKKSGTYTLPPDAELLFSTYKAFYDFTEGLFTPLIGSVLVDAGYDADYSLRQKKELTKPLKWEDVFEYAFPEIVIKTPALIDVGAAGKGYLIDIVSELIEKEGIRNYCVDAGGDIRQRSESNGGNILKVGLEDPEDFSRAIGVINISNRSLCASAGSRRKWQNFHHIINPETLSSPADIIAVWVIADSTILADALSTSLFFTNPAVFTQHFSFEYLIMKADRSVEVSAKFPGELFTA